MADENIIRKIQGLLNRNEKNGATKHEAETALRMAVRLMTEYDISEFDLKKVNKDSFVEQEILLKRMDITTLFTGLANAFDCEFYYRSHIKKGYFFGFELDGKMCVHFSKMITEIILKEITDYKKGYNYHCLIYNYQPRAVVKNFVKGFSHNLLEKLDEIRKSKEQVVLSSGTSLMVIKSQQVKDEFEKRHTCKVVEDKGFVMIGQAFLTGSERSDGIEFNKPLTDSSPEECLLLSKGA